MWVLDWDEHPSCEYWLFATDNLVTAEWVDLLGYSVNWPEANITGIVDNNSQAFFNVTEILSNE